MYDRSAQAPRGPHKPGPPALGFPEHRRPAREQPQRRDLLWPCAITHQHSPWGPGGTTICLGQLWGLRRGEAGSTHTRQGGAPLAAPRSPTPAPSFYEEETDGPGAGDWPRVTRLLVAVSLPWLHWLTPFVLASYGCCHKLPQIWCLKTRQVYSYSSRGQKPQISFTGLKSRWQGCAPSGGSRAESTPCLSQFLVAAGISLVYGYITPILVSVATSPSPFCVKSPCKI